MATFAERSGPESPDEDIEDFLQKLIRRQRVLKAAVVITAAFAGGTYVVMQSARAKNSTPAICETHPAQNESNVAQAETLVTLYTDC